MANVFDCGDCATRVPQFPEELCGIPQRNGGVKTAILFACTMQWDATVTVPPENEGDPSTTVTIGAMTDPAAWQLAIENGLIHKLPLSYIEIGEPEEISTKRFNGCQDEIPTGYRYPIAIKSSIADEALSDFDYWCNIQENWNYFSFGYIDCAGNFFIGEDGIGETIRGATVFYDGKPNLDDTIDWNFNFNLHRRGCLKPYQLPGVEQVLA